MPQPIVHFEIGARDTAKLKAFYEALFGWKVNFESMEGYGLIETKQGADAGIDGGLYQAGEGDRPGLRIYAEVDDADAYLSQAEALGGTIIQPAMDVPGVGIRAGVFTDPEGNAIGVAANTATE